MNFKMLNLYYKFVHEIIINCTLNLTIIQIERRKNVALTIAWTIVRIIYSLVLAELSSIVRLFSSEN